MALRRHLPIALLSLILSFMEESVTKQVWIECEIVRLSLAILNELHDQKQNQRKQINMRQQTYQFFSYLQEP